MPVFGLIKPNSPMLSPIGLGRRRPGRCAQTDAPKKLSIIVTDNDGQVVAGLLGETKWDWMYIGWVWVNEKYRTQGIGRKLMLEAEREAKAMQCHHAHLTTLDFQARAFYEKLGYAVFATMENYPQGHTRFLMKKAIA